VGAGEVSPTDRPEPLPGGDDLGVVEAVRAVDAAEAGVADAADLSWRNSQLFSDTGLQGRGPPASALPTEGTDMTTAIIGVGNIGATVARQLAAGGENLLIASQSKETADTLAAELGSNVSKTLSAQTQPNSSAR
jgi:phosphoglycerate dehydrogenase-like enzyme